MYFLIFVWGGKRPFFLYDATPLLIVISTPLKFSQLAYIGVFRVKIGQFKIQFGTIDYVFSEYEDKKNISFILFNIAVLVGFSIAHQ